MPIDEQGRPTPGSTRDLSPVAMDVVVPIDYWRQGAAYPPDGAKPRVDRLQLYRDLFDGMAQPERVRTNYYRRSSTFIGDLLASFPPMVEGIDDEFAKAVNRQLALAAYCIGVDQTRYGVADLRPLIDDTGPLIECADPRTWFPADEVDTDAFVSFGPDYGQGPTENSGCRSHSPAISPCECSSTRAIRPTRATQLVRSVN